MYASKDEYSSIIYQNLSTTFIYIQCDLSDSVKEAHALII